MPGTLAALASVPARAPLLFRTLESLAPQVDRLCVYLNGYAEVPDAVREFGATFVLDPENNGAERKFWWTEEHPGVYLSCDDDIIYPLNYARTMVHAVEDCGGTAIITAHGRSFEGTPRAIHQTKPGSIGMFHRRVDYGRPVNHGGTGAMAWDASRVKVPSKWPERNLADMQLAVWAQQNRVPMWQIPHQAHWLESPGLGDPDGIYRSSQREGHARRNRLLIDQGKRSPWKVFPVNGSAE